MQNQSVVEVFTGKTIEQMFEHGGSQSWILNPHSMRDVEFCVCVRNHGRDAEDGFSETDEPGHSAFFVGKVSGLRRVEHRNGRDRYLVLFSHYAIPEAPVEGFRFGSSRNPVLYSDVAHCKQRGLEIEALEFRPMPNPTDVSTPPAGRLDGLSIDEAKAGLSLRFGVPVDAIQITISA
jgi:hypothetical protein